MNKQIPLADRWKLDDEELIIIKFKPKIKEEIEMAIETADSLKDNSTTIRKD